MFPVTTGGKLFTFFVLVFGLGVIAVPTGLVASALAKARQEEGADEIENETDSGSPVRP